MNNPNKKHTRQRGLGKGVDALFLNEDSITQTPATAKTPSASSNTPQMIAVSAIIPGRYQPRKSFDDEAAAQITESVKLHGVLQPIIARHLPKEQKFELIAGERRWRAAQAIGLSVIPAMIRNVTDQQMMLFGLIENLQRENLNCLEEAEGIAQIINEHHITHEKAATLLSKSRSAITNALRLLDLSDLVKPFLREGVLEMGHARALLPLPPQAQKTLALLAIEHQLSVREVEKRVKVLLSKPKKKQPPSVSNLDHETQRFVTQLEEDLSLPIDLVVDKTGKGRLTLRFSMHSQLLLLLERLKNDESPPLSTETH